jgi:hypothetical protein
MLLIVNGVMERRENREDEMIQLSLDHEEATVLRDALATYISELRMEIVDTEQHEFRESLKREEVLLTKIVGQLKA